MRVRKNLIMTAGLSLLLAYGCGDSEKVNLDGDAGGDGSGGDGGAGDGAGDGDGDGDGSGDAGPGAECQPTETQCNNCIDDDKDGLVDGDDPHCAGPLDDDEATFATGIPGDNQDPRKQECFFDGNSGFCQVHTCCLTPGPCDEDLYGNFNPDQDCANYNEPCILECLDVTPPGCDCYGCCTVCHPETNECFDILAGASPDCGIEDLGNPKTMGECVVCTKSDVCNGGECDADNCVLCPGQTEEDLPDSCNDQNECPNDRVPCDTSADCDADEYCSAGCCVAGGVD